MTRLLMICLALLIPLSMACAEGEAPPGMDRTLATPDTATQAPTPADKSTATLLQSYRHPQDLPIAKVAIQPPPYFDYSVNLKSEVFGAQLFSGTFARGGATSFNPDYSVAVGDRIHVRLWGAFEYDDVLMVDPQGNIFISHVGPIKVLGVRNQELQKTVEMAVRRIFLANVNSYASLAEAQPVRVYVGGAVQRPGLYNGTSMDSLLHYLDQAGGIDPERGSFLNVQVKRGDKVRATINLYDFLLRGSIPVVQLSDGDVIFIRPRQHTVVVTGLAENTKRFEFSSNSITVADVMQLAKPRPQATHARVVRNSGTIKNNEYYPLEEGKSVRLVNGDEVAFTADKKPGTITVRVEGEHQSSQEYVLPYGAKVGELMSQITFTERSDSESVQLFRQSVRERQKQMLAVALKSLESSVLTARSETSDEAILRKEEAALVLQWVERAKAIEPVGQVLIAQSAQRDALLLENGDIIRVPIKDGLVLVSGEVLFPNAVAYDPKLAVTDFIRMAGGYAQNADTSRIVVAHRDGSFEGNTTNAGSSWLDAMGGVTIRPGDDILVLPKVDVKSMQITKDITQILFQLALSSKVILGL